MTALQIPATGGIENFGPAMTATIFQVQNLERMMEEELRGNPFAREADGPLRALERVRGALRDLQVARIKLEAVGHHT